jgi:hypothetical protein
LTRRILENVLEQRKFYGGTEELKSWVEKGLTEEAAQWSHSPQKFGQSGSLGTGDKGAIESHEGVQVWGKEKLERGREPGTGGIGNVRLERAWVVYIWVTEELGPSLIIPDKEPLTYPRSFGLGTPGVRQTLSARVGKILGERSGNHRPAPRGAGGLVSGKKGLE